MPCLHPLMSIMVVRQESDDLYNNNNNNGRNGSCLTWLAISWRKGAAGL